MTPLRQSDIYRLAEEFTQAAAIERKSYDQVEPLARRCREARAALYIEAVRVLLDDIDQIAEIATLLTYDAGAAGFDQLADQLGHTVGWWIRDQWRERAPRTPPG